MKKIIISSLAAVSMLSVMSCETDFDDRDVSKISITNGEADFSKYVALGNSLTSGYRDGALYSSGQLESYPSIIASQMQKAGGGDFTQPLMPNDIGGFSDLSGFPGKLVLSLENGSLTPTYSAAGGALDKLTGTFNNMGVPGAKSFHLVADGYGSQAGLALGKANPYFVRFASSASTSVLKDAMAQKPTFFSLWIGNNDALYYAASGGVGKDQTGNLNPATYGANDITDPDVLAGSIKAVLDGMKAVGATKGVIANIPNVTSIPFFTTIPYNPVPLTAAQASELNQNLAGVNQVLDAYKQGGRFVTLKEGSNPLLIKDETLKDMSAEITAALSKAGIPVAQATVIGKVLGQARHTTAEDLIPLSTRQVINTKPSNPYAVAPFDKYGVTFPLEDQHVLIPSEKQAVLTATAKYNASIKALADTYGLAFVDANAKMVELNSTSGIQFDGVKYTASFVTGGAFSLDGVHLTGRGYAVIANEFIKAINAKYKSTLPQVSPNSYSGIKFP
ncbi:G-D-S-L family lipolytic protein [Riemerella anatipestifer]|uniref:G-D-S-L family lipolytic protein n=1 Tax=Riemerella anatipestifer TaxID=34085 RepID=UPI002A8E755F|nr:G-D-S-L family lipolytic protein [Riemerella anatipestifer]MDY3520218.1 G-D-S-L family lipolytic protein [Riemerella anatipestifer]MDY3532902.1 G-D-S-L family lipolytic protein [Riemerella anatipestifer]MDY3534543.1 G-D-S-L family lipolytic protein [Riemerella anatipestifer]